MEFEDTRIVELQRQLAETQRLAKALCDKIDNRINEIDPLTRQKVWRKGCIKMLEEVSTWAEALRAVLPKETP